MIIARYTLLLIFISLLTITMSGVSVFAQNEDLLEALEEQLEEKAGAIEEIEEEIDAYQEQLVEINQEKQTLQGALRELDLSRDRISAQINLTQQEIDLTTLEIQKLRLEIKDKESNIELNNDALGETIRRIDQAESQSLIETLLAYNNLSEFWIEADDLSQFSVIVQNDLTELAQLTKELEGQKKEFETTENELMNLRNEFQIRGQAVDANRSAQDQLLQATKNEESTYQQLLSQKVAEREKFLRELASIEAEIQIVIDPSKIPDSGDGILTWPVDTVRITQNFGQTAFATQNPQVYSGSGHNGIDFGVPTGSNIRSTLTGMVVGTGNTDEQPGCYSYGKWVLVEHPNGLSSLYAHLSSIGVSRGQTVGTGEIIGFSGNTGYSTGPHLHFTIFASDGVQLKRLGDVKKVTGCSNMTIPIAPHEAYLNPLSYLPSL